MVLSDISIRRPVFAMVINILVVVAGIICFTSLPLREYPDIDPPLVSIETTYLGASAEVVESRVTQILGGKHQWNLGRQGHRFQIRRRPVNHSD
jgi:multidrug efflux pump